MRREAAQFNQLMAQILGGAAGVVLALGFEWAFTKAAGLLSKDTQRIAKIIETVENPFNAAVSAGINIYATTTAAKSAERAGPSRLDPDRLPLGEFRSAAHARQRDGAGIRQASGGYEKVLQ